ncbi:DUF1214 domain-containing protein [Rhodococcus sp. MS16]|uniref:DUF1214 domain-containing protein n=1 Tax=Rhodococcus sp. MS16 TaxID=2579941 RepID=UPI001561D94D|nr:DUF1214 domain-containing protein [Rhodococcus sp. MS16]NRI67034.1 DUF1214 domain-containing protein [Rhodococcus sp. MS16]
MTLPGQASVPAEAFTYLADMIRDFPEKFAQLPMPDNAIDAAEGNRLFLRYLTIGIEQFIEYTDPAYPDFQQKTRAGVRKFSGDSPAQLYDSSPVSSKYQYIVTGSMAETELIELTVYSGDLSGANKTPRRLIDAITEAEIDTTTDGSFTLTVAAGHEGRNGVKLDTDASVLSVRRYLRDPRVDRPRPLSIRRIGGPVNPPPLTADALATGLERAAQFAWFNTRTWAQWVGTTKTEKFNALSPMHDSGDIFTPAGHKYLNGYWAVPEGYALRISFTPPTGAYWSFVPMNYWMESLEWRFGNRVFATSFDTEPDETGRIELVLAHDDPKFPGATWLETLGHSEGTMAFRFARCHNELPETTIELICLDKCRGDRTK